MAWQEITELACLRGGVYGSAWHLLLVELGRI